MMTGGHLKDIPRPHRRRFPGEKRVVRVLVSRYDMVGGYHYYVSLVEEFNPIWDSRTYGETGWGGDEIIGWREARDDVGGKGKQEHSLQLDHRFQVEDFIQEAVRELFPPETHVLHDIGGGPYEPYDEAEGMEGRYYYQREGD